MNTRLKHTRAQVILMSVALAFVVGCGPQKTNQSSSGRKNPQTSNTTPSNNTPTNPTQSTALAIASKSVLVNGRSTTLQQIAQSNGKAVTVFQFSGVTCESCKVDSPLVSKQLQPYASKVAKVVLFPNQPDEYTAAEYGGFVNSYSPASSYAIDGDLSVLKGIRKKSSQFFGLYIIMRADGSGVILNEDNSYQYVLNSVTQLLN